MSSRLTAAETYDRIIVILLGDGQTGKNLKNALAILKKSEKQHNMEMLSFLGDLFPDMHINEP